MGIPICVECGSTSNPCRCKVVGPTLGFLVFIVAAVVEWPVGALVYCFRHSKGRRIMAHPVTVVYPVTFICGSRRAMTRTLSRRKKERIVRLGNKKKPIARLQSNLSSKALLMVKMISWRKVDQHEDEQEKDEEEGFDGSDDAVWRRTIMMGEKCRPLDFSGKILYDCHGNLLPSS